MRFQVTILFYGDNGVAKNDVFSLGIKHFLRVGITTIATLVCVNFTLYFRSHAFVVIGSLVRFLGNQLSSKTQHYRIKNNSGVISNYSQKHQ
jgi:hypothetical protein